MADVVIVTPAAAPAVVNVLGPGVGPVGPGVAAGGTTGQVLAKTSNADYATAWVTPSSGGGGGGGVQNTYIQATEPTPTPGSGAFIWYVLDGTGAVTDIRKGVA